MKNNKSYIFTYLFTLVGGVLLTTFHSRTDIFELIITLIGILFLLPSIFSIVGGLVSYHYFRKNGGKRYNWFAMIPAVAGIIFGTILMIKPDIFRDYLIITFGILLIVCGLIQLFNQFSNRVSLKGAAYYLIIPSLTIIFGVFVLILGPEKIGNIVTLWTGIILICYSINGLIGTLHKSHHKKQEVPISSSFETITSNSSADEQNKHEESNNIEKDSKKSTYLSE